MVAWRMMDPWWTWRETRGSLNRGAAKWTALVAALAAFLAAAARAEPAVDHPVAERLTRWFSPELRRTEQCLRVVAGELADLPELRPQPFASRYGYRSENLPEQEKPHWLQIDLLRSEVIDRIVAMPVNVPAIGEGGAGYGFPLRFKIEVADNPAMTDAVTVVDRTTEDVVNPGRYPLGFPLAGVRGRYLRFTSTRHYPVDGGFIWALEELIVLSGKRTVAVDKPLQASSSLELFPNWALTRILDGQSALGMPVTRVQSPTRGYLSSPAEIDQASKWLQVDLGREYPVDEIRLMPVESDNFEILGLKSFPRAWTLELAKDPAFTEISWRFQMPKTNLVGYPGRCAVVIPSFGHRGRYLRLTTQDLWGRADRIGFALAELQAYSGDENVAGGKVVTASDVAGDADPAEWSPAFLVDGFTSRHRLVELPEYLDLIDKRGRLEAESQFLTQHKAGILDQASRVLIVGGVTFGTVLVFGWGWLLVRQRTVRQRAVTELRDQIARDLHDDIGSNLGGIVLLSEIGSRHSSDPRTRADFSAIKEAADETSASMRDIVWLIQRGNTGLRDLVTKMRQSTQAILGDKEVSLVVEPPGFRDRQLSLLFRRHVFFAFKETLNNVRRHAAASSVEVRITIGPRHLDFSVRDNGAGFDLQPAVEPGHGLGNLMRRASRLHGNCQLESRPGQGTLVTFKAPMKSRSR
jgi:signal transduction histidine kinase